MKIPGALHTGVESGCSDTRSCLGWGRQAASLMEAVILRKRLTTGDSAGWQAPGKGRASPAPSSLNGLLGGSHRPLLEPLAADWWIPSAPFPRGADDLVIYFPVCSSWTVQEGSLPASGDLGRKQKVWFLWSLCLFAGSPLGPSTVIMGRAKLAYIMSPSVFTIRHIFLGV